MPNITYTCTTIIYCTRPLPTIAKQQPNIMTLPRMLLLLWVALCNLSWTPNPDNDFFEHYYQIINQNIEEELYDANITLIKELKQKKAYQELDCYRKGKLLHKIGVSHYGLLQDEEAIEYYQEVVLDVWKDCAEVPPSERANTIYNMGVSYQYLDQMDLAKEYIDQSLYFFENDPEYSRLDLAEIYHGIGNFYHDLNDAFRAELYYQNAIGLYQEIDKTEAMRFELLNELVDIHRKFKEYGEAKNYIDKALSLYDSNPTVVTTLNLGVVYISAGTTYFELKDYETTKQMAKKALEILNEERAPFYYSIALETIAMIQEEEGELETAEETMYRVLNIRKALYLKGESQHEIALAYENLCDILLRKGAVARAEQHLKQAFELLLPLAKFDRQGLPLIQQSKIIDDNQLIRLIELKGKIFEARYQNSGEIAFLEHALNAQYKIDSVINRSLVSFQFEQSKLDFLEVRFEHYGKAVSDALQLHRITKDRAYLEKAYYFASKTKAIVLQQELNQIDAIHSTVPEEMVFQEQALREKMNALYGQLLESSDDNDSILKAYTRAQYDLDAYLEEIEREEPAYFKEKYAFIRPPSIKNVRKTVPKDMAVVEYFIGKDSIYSFWIGRNRFFPVTVPYDLELQQALKSFTAQCRDPQKKVSQKFSRLLSKKLVGKGLAEMDDGIDRLCIIPDGPLHNLPFEALSGSNDPSTYLIEQYAISYSYSVALLFREDRKKDLKTYVGFGTSYSKTLNEKLKARKRFFGNENLEQLTLSKREIGRGATIFDGETYIDEDATLANFLEHGDDADVLHLSLHGLVDTDDPARSCIIFDDHPEKFILSPLELYGRQLSADLVLLSACHSASGKIYNGEGVQGMSKSFLLSGAHNILSSLWNASETSSMAITTAFLENVHAGQPTDLALHRSKLAYLSKTEPNKRHPYYWANFILLGEVDAPSTFLKSTFFWITLGLVCCVALATFLYVKTRKNTIA